ncbi:TetR/AcrR family transcriptional regulator [Alkalihalobacillus oceani]|uniref:TetR/AcrR family transcriptional regulator n=1 Tax=Halalkalibacter oceani TaxID=1653776 RepID=UPI00203AEFB3|nr:TetR/AcrR family transcriptional regulator [Halalkalibacter oceani]MCM3761006.1 TetR/AcrR family transcriptional regulator [Halalkalibacter oceani]
MDAKREAILKAAEETFSSFGYKGTSVDKIAKFAKVGKGTIYNYFETKEDILLEIIHVIIREVKEKADEVIRPEVPVFINFNNAISEILNYRDVHELLRTLAKEIDWTGSPLVANALKKIETEAIHYLADLLQKAIEANKIEPCEPELTAFLIYKLYIAVVTEWAPQQSLSAERLAAILENSIMNGLLTERQAGDKR